MEAIHAARDDAHEAWRSLRRDPGYAGTVGGLLILCLTLNLALYTLLYHTVLKRPGFPEFARFVYVLNADEDRGLPFTFISLPEYEARAASDVFEQTAVFAMSALPLERQGRLHYNQAHRIGEDLFAVYGVEPVLGRFFTEEDHQGLSQTTVLSEQYWEAVYQRDPAALGQTIQIEGRPHTIVGIAPEAVSEFSHVWVPISQEEVAAGMEGDYRFFMVGRLREGMDRDTALQTLQAVDDAFYAASPLGRPTEAFGTRLMSHQEFSTLTFGTYIIMMQATALILLLLGVFNMASLSLGRMHGRLHELGLRHVVGAGLERLNRVLAFEVLFLIAAACLVAIALASWAFDGLEWVIFQIIGVTFDLQLDLTSLLTFVGIAAALGLIASALAVLHINRLDLNSIIRQRSYTYTVGRMTLRWQLVLLIFQFAGTTVLLSVAANLGHWYLQAATKDSGVAWEHVSQVRMRGNDLAALSPEARPQAMQTLGAEVQARVGGQVGMAYVPVFRLGYLNLLINRPSQDASPEAPNRLSAQFNAIDDGFLDTVGIPLVTGRAFAPDDHLPDQPLVALISADLAIEGWGSVEEALGQTLPLDATFPELPAGDYQIVGVTGGHNPQLGLPLSRSPVAYLPLGRCPTPEWTLFNDQVSDPADGPTLDDHVAAVLATQLPATLPTKAEPLQAARQAALIATGSPFTAVAVFGLVGLLLGLIGLHATMARYLALYRREYAIRRALGAKRVEALRRAVRMLLVFMALGSVVSLLLVEATHWLPAVLRIGSDGVPLTVGLLVVAVINVLLALFSIFPLRRLTQDVHAQDLLQDV